MICLAVGEQGKGKVKGFESHSGPPTQAPLHNNIGTEEKKENEHNTKLFFFTHATIES